MKKAVLVSLAAVAAALTVSSCADTLSDLELTVPSTSEIVLYSGQSQTCSFDVANSGGYLLKGTAVPSNPLYRAEVAINSQMDGGTVTVYAPEYIFKDEDFTVDVTVEDGINGRRKATTLQVKAKALENIQPFDTPANAFIAKPGSLVKIPAQRGANGGVLSFDAADLLWQDAQGLVKAVVLDPSDASSIYVELNADATGNAVVCAKSSGQIVWSWHLWVTDYDPAASTMDWKDADGVTYSFMDRDLGAMTSVPGTDAAHGNFYNWGRKDPFPGAKFDAAEYKPAYNLAGEVVEFPKVDNEAVSNIEGSIANPLNRYLALGRCLRPEVAVRSLPGRLEGSFLCCGGIRERCGRHEDEGVQGRCGRGQQCDGRCQLHRRRQGLLLPVDGRELLEWQPGQLRGRHLALRKALDEHGRYVCVVVLFPRRSLRAQHAQLGRTRQHQLRLLSCGALRKGIIHYIKET